MLGLRGPLSPQASKAWLSWLAGDWPHQALLPLPGHPGLGAVLAPLLGTLTGRPSGGCCLASHCWLAGRRVGGQAEYYP